jgi:transcriptional regulator with XRE-family HTH domain
VSTLATSAADELVQSAIPLNPATKGAPSNALIGSRVRIRRTSRGMTQQDLSDLLGVDRSNLAAYEAGVERINANLLLRIAKLLDVRPDYFFRGFKKEDWRAA